MEASRASTYFRWWVAAAVLGLLAWQGHHLAHWLPQFERTIENAGPWGPVFLCLAILLLEPFLVPDTLFALAAGAAFGLLEGTILYFAAVYVMCLGVQWLGGHWLKARVLQLLEARPSLRQMVSNVSGGGVRVAFLVRLVPVNQALLSYAMGAAGISLRSALVGNLGMFTHMFPTVYFGVAAVHMTRMAATGHKHWETEGVVLMLGLVVVVILTLLLARRARTALGVAQGADPGLRAERPGSKPRSRA